MDSFEDKKDDPSDVRSSSASWVKTVVGEVSSLYNEEMVGERNVTRNVTSPVSLWGECRTEVWRCLSSHAEEGVRNIHKPADLLG